MFIRTGDMGLSCGIPMCVLVSFRPSLSNMSTIRKFRKRIMSLLSSTYLSNVFKSPPNSKGDSVKATDDIRRDYLINLPPTFDLREERLSPAPFPEPVRALTKDVSEHFIPYWRYCIHNNSFLAGIWA